MSNNEPSYLTFARANVRDGMTSSPTIVKALLARIDTLEAESRKSKTTTEATK